MHKELDLIGFALFGPAAIMLLLALQYGGNQFAWNSSQVIGLFVGSAVTFVVFALWEAHKGDSAMIPGSIMKRRTVWASCITFGFLMSLLYIITYYLPIYFQAVKGVTPTMSGVYLLPTIIAQLFAAGLSGFLGKLFIINDIKLHRQADATTSPETGILPPLRRHGGSV